MTDFLLELRSEEIPARMQKGARADLERLFREQMSAAGVAVGELTVWSTPRRLALIARGLPEATEAASEEAKGPPVGAPDQAVDGFCKKSGVTRDQLEIRDVKGRETWFAVKDIPGRAVKDVLAEAIPAIVRAFPWPKSQRWGAASLSTESLRWVRPLSGIVAIFGEELVECEVGDVASGYATMGHRFHHPGEITIGGADDYAEKLRACHVIVDHEEREALIREGAAKAAADAGLVLVEDEGLVIENAGLTEWPVPLLGRFDEAFLDVPPEVIQLTARVNQKYFVCTSPLPLAGGAGGGPETDDQASPTPNPDTDPGLRAGGKREGDALANAFVCTANISAEDGGAAIVDGNRKVLAARLADARFFWELDQKTPLADHAKKLERITFHEKLGTVADKVDRVAKLARWLCEEGVVKPEPVRPEPVEGPGETPATRASTSSARTVSELADLAEQAARLCKADLVTEMVGEFPELQGLMGGYYAKKEDLPQEVSDAIRDHYKPVGQGDEVPTAPVTVAVSLADKLDTLVCFFAVRQRPTGSKDPFALRRAALAYLSLVLKSDIRVRLMPLLDEMDRLCGGFYRRLWLSEVRTLEDTQPKGAKLAPENESHISFSFDLLDFFADRLKVQQREAGVRHDLIDAVFALGGEDDLIRLLARVHALQSFMATEDGANLLAGYKRAANILKKEGVADTNSVTPAQAGVQGDEGETGQLESHQRGNDDDEMPPRTGEEDPYALVDDPDLGPVLAAKMRERSKLSYTPEKAEKALIDALDSAEPKAAAAIAGEDFEGAMAALASLRAPIDTFFDEVTVNADEENKRTARLALLARFRAAVHNVADFSHIEG